MKKDKELAVYDAVASLLQAGRSITDLTVADIAKEAGIGKGTVYDYFKTKDEIVAKALAYGITKNVQRARLAVQQAADFEGRVEAFLLVVDEVTQSRMPFFDAMTGCGLTGGLEQHVNWDGFVQSVRTEGKALAGEIRRAALREGILRQDVPESQVSFVIFGSLAGYLLYAHLGSVEADLSRGEARRQVIRGLKVSLAAM